MVQNEPWAVVLGLNITRLPTSALSQRNDCDADNIIGPSRQFWNMQCGPAQCLSLHPLPVRHPLPCSKRALCACRQPPVLRHHGCRQHCAVAAMVRSPLPSSIALSAHVPSLPPLRLMSGLAAHPLDALAECCCKHLSVVPPVVHTCQQEPWQEDVILMRGTSVNVAGSTTGTSS